MKNSLVRLSAAVMTAGVALLLAGCERPPMDSTQSGYRGTAMGAVVNPRIQGPLAEAQVLPAAVPAIPSAEGGPLAKDVFKNVTVLGDVPVGEFTRTMLAITAWVSPKEGCTYCHKEGEDLAADTLYTKVVSRRMLEMTRHINSGWKDHVADTGVTCYTCHRGQPVPDQVWFSQEPPRRAGGASARSDGHNHPSPVTGLTAIDNNVLVRYLLQDTPIRAGGTTALPAGNTATIQQTENTFGLMIHMSQALGVNCTHCHNTRSLAEWAESPPARTTAFHGIRMSRELNNSYLLPLTPTFPANRLGPTGDVAKVSCATCHQGLAKPLNGAPLLKDHGVLAGAVAAPAGAASAPAAAASSTASIVPARGVQLVAGPAAGAAPR
jgi:photosynthetic reaction center cytochrome c subunit